MRKFLKILNHAVDFLLLAAILGGALYALYFFRHLVEVQIIISVVLGILYIVWGIFHHGREGNLKKKIIWEYVSIGALVVFILIIFLLRA